MKKLTYLLAIASLALTACDKNGNNQPDPEGTTYPRVQLIEHFTGEGCGYCPYGMNYIDEIYSANPDAYVWISNHTYGKDEFSIAESSTIAKKLGVSGAPEISINRNKYDGERIYHPYYTSQYIVKEATTATSTISIDRTYNSAANDLKITVNGRTSDKQLEKVLLTVAITESGMVGAQSDYLYSWEGWRKFTHTHAVRAYLTAAMGDEVEVKNGSFTYTLNGSMAAGWKEENCMIVAWITAGGTLWPVLNAAKMPVVEGTKGGEDIHHGGIEEVPVSETYPESGAPATDVTLKEAYVYTFAEDGSKYAQVIAINRDTTFGKASGYDMFPYFELYLKIPSDATSVPNGTYQFVANGTEQIGDAIAGFRNDEEHTIDASKYLYTVVNNNSFYMAKQWMLVAGSVTFTEEGFTVSATTKNGSPVQASFSGSVQAGKAPSRAARIEEIE